MPRTTRAKVTALLVDCPKCGAAVGVPCLNPQGINGVPRPRPPHVVRVWRMQREARP
jgi:hypothetical protein